MIRVSQIASTSARPFSTTLRDFRNPILSNELNSTPSSSTSLSSRQRAKARAIDPPFERPTSFEGQPRFNSVPGTLSQRLQSLRKDIIVQPEDLMEPRQIGRIELNYRKDIMNGLKVDYTPAKEERKKLRMARLRSSGAKPKSIPKPILEILPPPPPPPPEPSPPPPTPSATLRVVPPHMKKLPPKPYVSPFDELIPISSGISSSKKPRRFNTFDPVLLAPIIRREMEARAAAAVARRSTGPVQKIRKE